MNLSAVWIDHAHAFLVRSAGQDIDGIEEIHSEVERHHDPGAQGEHVTISNQQRVAERREQEMNHFCKDLIKKLQNADEILIFGPGNAKYDLKKAIEKEKALATKLKDVLTSDKLTDAEMRDFVRTHLKLPR